MATQYQVHIEMSVETVEALGKSGFHLYGFKAVRTPMGGGAPLVWFKTDTYSASTDVTWSTQYQAYTSRDEIRPMLQIEASFSANADLNQTLEVTSKSGTGTVIGGGTPSAISVLNKTAEEFVCGISQVQKNKSNPICAFPLFGSHLDVFAPIEKVLLLFSTDAVNTGTVIEQAYGPGVFIDLTGAPSNQRVVSYDINKSWSWDGGLWARTVGPSEGMVPLLIENSASAAAGLMSAA